MTMSTNHGWPNEVGQAPACRSCDFVSIISNVRRQPARLVIGDLAEMDAQPNPQFLCTSYVNDYPGGPLHVTAIEEGKLRIVSVLYGTEVARLRLVGGATVDELLATLKVIQHTATTFPIEQLEKIVWSDFSPDIVLTYHDGNKCKTARTCIASDEDKKQLLSAIGNSVTTPMKCSDELASVLSVAWSQFDVGSSRHWSCSTRWTVTPRGAHGMCNHWSGCFPCLLHERLASHPKTVAILYLYFLQQSNRMI